MYAGLVELGLTHPEKGEPANFRNRLKREGLPASRASEIKVILEDPPTAQKFSTNGMTVREAIEGEAHRQPDQGRS